MTGVRGSRDNSQGVHCRRRRRRRLSLWQSVVGRIQGRGAGPIRGLILEEEKKAQVLLLEEEFKLRNELEEKFYQQKRKALEEAAAEVQAEAYAGMGDGGGGGAVGDETSGQQIS